MARVGAPATQFPPGMAHGAAADDELSRTVAQASGTEMAALGVTMVFAPVADEPQAEFAPSMETTLERELGRDLKGSEVSRILTLRAWAAFRDNLDAMPLHYLRKAYRFWNGYELPQIVNVFKGEMSFVGPRPERPEFVEGLKKTVPYYSERHTVLPGVTGWAQIQYPYGASTHDAAEKLQYDLYYVKHHNVFLDIMIILQTVEVVLWGKGSR